VPADGFFGPSPKNENLPVFNGFPTFPSLPPSRQQIRLSAPPIPCWYGQRLHPSHHAAEQPPRQMALGQRQPVVARVLDRPAAGLHQPLRCKLVSDQFLDLLRRLQPPPEAARRRCMSSAISRWRRDSAVSTGGNSPASKPPKPLVQHAHFNRPSRWPIAVRGWSARSRRSCRRTITVFPRRIPTGGVFRDRGARPWVLKALLVSVGTGRNVREPGANGAPMSNEAPPQTDEMYFR